MKREGGGGERKLEMGKQCGVVWSRRLRTGVSRTAVCDANQCPGLTHITQTHRDICLREMGGLASGEREREMLTGLL